MSDTQKPRILFVCSLLGARSLLACHFLNELCGDQISAKAAGFEKDTFGPRIRNFLAERGITLPEESPETVFTCYSNKEEFDYVVLMCTDAAKELCPIFSRSVNTLYQTVARQVQWHIPDFRSIQGDQQFVMEQWDLIVEQIREKAADFAEQELNIK